MCRRPSLRPLGLALAALALWALPVAPFLARVEAAISVSILLEDSSPSDLDPYVSNIASGFAANSTITCATNALCLAFVSVIETGVETPTLTGGGQTTWTLHDTISGDTIASPTMHIYTFRTLGEGGAAAALTADFADAQLTAVFQVVQFTGVDTSGTNGSGAITQCDNVASNSTTTTAPDALAALQATNAVIHVGLINASNRALTAEAGWTIGASGTTLSESSPASEAVLQYRVDTTDNTPTLTQDGAATDFISIACEIKEAGAGGAAPGPLRFSLLGVG